MKYSKGQQTCTVCKHLVTQSGQSQLRDPQVRLNLCRETTLLDSTKTIGTSLGRVKLLILANSLGSAGEFTTKPQLLEDKHFVARPFHLIQELPGNLMLVLLQAHNTLVHQA